jgi:hypothetical protein
MPWQETSPVEERGRFIDDRCLRLYTMTELCQRYAVSRETGYKWIARYDAGGRLALGDGSRAPHRSSRNGADVGRCITPASSADHDCAQRPLGHRPHGPVPHGRPPVLRPAHRLQSAHALLARVPGLALDAGRGRAPDLRAPLPRVWAAAGDSHRQRRALRLHLTARPHTPQRLVVAPGHSTPADPAGASRAEWRPRTHAHDAEAQGVPTTASDARRATAGLQPLSAGV